MGGISRDTGLLAKLGVVLDPVGDGAGSAGFDGVGSSLARVILERDALVA